MTQPAKFEVTGIGEILWDLLPSGKKLGGAPANFTYHAQALGASARLISRVGEDALGREIVERWSLLGVAADTIQTDKQFPTGTVSVELAEDGQPRYTIHEYVAWDMIQVDEASLAVVAKADVVCFGSLAQRTKPGRAAITKLVGASRPEALRIFDVNLRLPFVSRDVVAESLDAANVLKLNEHELPIVAQMFDLAGAPSEQLAALANRFSLRLVALTRGGEGSVLWAGGAISEHRGMPTVVRDTVGAGDAFTAAMALGFLQKWALDEINARANLVAAFVCSQPGATPALPVPLRHLFEIPAELASDATGNL